MSLAAPHKPAAVSRFRALPSCILFLCLAALALALAGCRRPPHTVEVGYVYVPQVTLRDRVAAVFAKVGTVRNGERVVILEKTRGDRYVRVRSPRGEEGWMESRYLVDQSVFDALAALAAQNAGVPVQAAASIRRAANLHVEPNRDSDHLYLLDEGAKVQVLKRVAAAKPAGTGPAAPAPEDGSAPPPAMEDWWLVRDAQGHAGWVLGRMLDPDVPLEVGQYAEGRRIVAYFVLNQVADGAKQVPQYLLLLSDPKDGLPFDFNQVRVFTWNPKKQRYETAYRERPLGMLPARVGKEDFGGKEGKLPVFVLRLEDQDGKLFEQKYKMNGVMVRKVQAPGQEAPKPSHAPAPSTPRRSGHSNGHKSHGRHA